MGKPSSVDQEFYRIRDDTTAANPGTPNWITTENQSTREVIDVSSGDVTFRIRFVIANTGGTDETSTFEIYANKNSTSYVLVPGTSTAGIELSSGASSSSDATSLTRDVFQLSSGTGIAIDGEYDSSAGANANLTAGDYFELEFGLNLDAANLSDADTFDFQVYHGGSAPDVVDTNATAIIEIQKAANTDVALNAGSFALTGQATTEQINRGVALAAGSFALTGQATTEQIDRGVSLAAGSFAVTGYDATVIPPAGNTDVPLDAGSFTLTGQATTEQINRGVALAAGSFALTGFDVAAAIDTSVALDAGSFSITGFDVAAAIDTTVALDAGSFSLTGYALNLDVGLSLEAGSFALTGHDVTVDTVATTNVPLDAGTFAMSGHDANVELAIGLDLAAGTFSMTGLDAVLTIGESVQEETPPEVWWPIVMEKRRRRERRIAAEKLKKARKSAKRKITLHIRDGKPVTESALMKLVEASVTTAAPDAPEEFQDDAALNIMIDLAAHIRRVADEEDAILLLL